LHRQCVDPGMFVIYLPAEYHRPRYVYEYFRTEFHGPMYVIYVPQHQIFRSTYI